MWTANGRHAPHSANQTVARLGTSRVCVAVVGGDRFLGVAAVLYADRLGERERKTTGISITARRPISSKLAVIHNPAAAASEATVRKIQAIEQPTFYRQ